MTESTTVSVTPQRIQRRRTRNWRLPENTIIVDRTTGWGNPFTAADAIVANYENPMRACVAYYEAWITNQLVGAEDTYIVGQRVYDRRWIQEHLHELAGRNLACPCKPGQPCHADVLIRLSNEVTAS